MAQRRVEYQGRAFDISYEKIQSRTTDSIKDYIIFLHGWGSEKSIMKKAFGECFKDFIHIYVDMPGFGNSPNEVILNTSDYAGIMKAFILSVCERSASECTIVGHSFGGKVATLCAPKELILLSSSGIIVPKPLSVKAKIKLAKLAKKLGISKMNRIFRSKDVANMSEVMYQTFKNVVNEDFSASFSAFSGRASIFWGEEDRATPLYTGKKIAQLIQNHRFFALKGNHYFFLDKGAMIERLYRES